jgi:hypothetical protein
MAFSLSIDKPSRATAATRHDRRIRIAGVFPGVVAELYRNWRREAADRADLRHVDPKDLGYPAELTGRADGTAPSALARLGLLGFALLVAGLGLVLLQQWLLPGL